MPRPARVKSSREIEALERGWPAHLAVLLEPLAEPELERFFTHVLYADSGCWLWRSKRGFSLRGINISPYWVSARVAGVEIAPGYEMHHTCANGSTAEQACVNPEHLRMMTPADHKRLHFSNPEWEAARVAKIKATKAAKTPEELAEHGRKLSAAWDRIKDDPERYKEIMLSRILGTHNRWHVARERVSPKCPFCLEQNPGTLSNTDGLR